MREFGAPEPLSVLQQRQTEQVNSIAGFPLIQARIIQYLISAAFRQIFRKTIDLIQLKELIHLPLASGPQE
jgi:hypothetical protein